MRAQATEYEEKMKERTNGLDAQRKCHEVTIADWKEWHESLGYEEEEDDKERDECDGELKN